MFGSVIKTFANECLLASNLGISFFASYRFGVQTLTTKDCKVRLKLWGSCQGKVYCSRDISKPQTIKFPRGKLPREKSVTLQKIKFPEVNCQQVEFTYR